MNFVSNYCHMIAFCLIVWWSADERACERSLSLRKKESCYCRNLDPAPHWKFLCKFKTDVSSTSSIILSVWKKQLKDLVTLSLWSFLALNFAEHFTALFPYDGAKLCTYRWFIMCRTCDSWRISFLCKEIEVMRNRSAYCMNFMCMKCSF